MEEAFSTRKLVEPKDLKALNTKSDLRGGLQMASHLATIAGFGYLHFLAMGSWWGFGYWILSWCDH